MTFSMADLRLIAVPSFQLLPSRSGKKRWRVNQPRVTLCASALGWVVPPRLLREDFFERILRLVLGHLGLRAQHADSPFLPLRFSGCGVEYFEIDEPDP